MSAENFVSPWRCIPSALLATVSILDGHRIFDRVLHLLHTDRKSKLQIPATVAAPFHEPSSNKRHYTSGVFCLEVGILSIPLSMSGQSSIAALHDRPCEIVLKKSVSWPDTTMSIIDAVFLQARFEPLYVIRPV